MQSWLFSYLVVKHCIKFLWKSYWSSSLMLKDWGHKHSVQWNRTKWLCKKNKAKIVLNVLKRIFSPTRNFKSSMFHVHEYHLKFFFKEIFVGQQHLKWFKDVRFENCVAMTGNVHNYIITLCFSHVGMKPQTSSSFFFQRREEVVEEVTWFLSLNGAFFFFLGQRISKFFSW